MAANTSGQFNVERLVRAKWNLSRKKFQRDDNPRR